MGNEVKSRMRCAEESWGRGWGYSFEERMRSEECAVYVEALRLRRRRFFFSPFL